MTNRSRAMFLLDQCYCVECITTALNEAELRGIVRALEVVEEGKRWSVEKVAGRIRALLTGEAGKRALGK